MIVLAEHPDALFEQFVAGTLSSEETEQILAHLDTCERCLGITEQMWEATPLLGSLAETGEVTAEMEEDRAQRIEQRVLNQIHRSDIAGRALWLGTQGFAQVSFALLRPLLEKLSR